ncbi:hypothetical protein, partial [Enterocloster bolteae]|uniref:hypothetical protein n=1 Tax=Enterocloster bolteae TaxID=208479 RepID=UPI0028DCCD84
MLEVCFSAHPNIQYRTLFHLSCFYAERIFVRSAVLSCAGQGALGQEVLGQGALRQEALLWFLQSPGVPYVISL